VVLLCAVRRHDFARSFAAATAVAIGVTAALTAPAYAQTDDQRSAARAAATEGLQALSEGRYKDALDLCTRAESLMHAPTHLLLIARAQIKLGHLVEAQEAYIRVTRDALAPDAPRAFVEAQHTAADEQAELAPRVPSLKVDVEGAGPQKAQVTLDGKALAPALVGLAMPINPGTYTLAATGPGLEAAPVTVTVAEGAKPTVLLSLKALAPRVATEAEVEAPAPSAETSQGHGGVKAAGWVSLAVGVAGLAAGTVFLVMNHSEESDATGACSPSHCPDSLRSTVISDENSASTDATLAWIGYGVGAVGVIVGGALLWAGSRSSGSSEQPAATAAFVPVIGPRSAGFRVAF
jgi:hypothetical protein